MLPRLILYSFLIGMVWLIRRDTVTRGGVPASVWIPTLWLGILVSRPLSAWFGVSGIREDLESATAGSPIDMLGFMGLIAAAMIVLSKRQVNWGGLIQRNWPIFLFYGYFLLSVVWANNPFVSFKRWFKEFGNILVALVILTEANPGQALRVVFVRCAYVLIPLSEIFIRYFPDLGRVYNIHSGEMMSVGVTFQKNSLGAMVLVCSLMLIWDVFELWQEGRRTKIHAGRAGYLIRIVVLIIGAYLLKLCDSKTSMVCLVMSVAIILASRSRILRPRLSLLATLGVVGIAGFLILDQIFGIKEAVVSGLGRDMTFTGRTEVWEALLSVGTDPIFGTGFCSFWDDLKYQSQLPYFVAFSAHNGYLEIYLAGGFVGVCFLALMLLATWFRIHKALAEIGDFAVLRFAILVITLFANFSESYFAIMSPVGFIFLIAALTIPHPVPAPQPVATPETKSRDASTGFGGVHQLAWSPV